MTNLIDNASKYSFDNSTVTIQACFFNNEIQIKVIDEAVKIMSLIKKGRVLEKKCLMKHQRQRIQRVIV